MTSAEPTELPPSSSRIDYSLRQNKTIERSIVFSGLRTVIQHLGLRNVVYIGLGSVWFSDFHLAHRELNINEMISLECDELTYARASFNRPYRTLQVIHGFSDELMPELLAREDLRGRPWIVWLDYDKTLDEGRRDEVDRLIRTMPDNSFLLLTFSGSLRPYGNPATRLEGLRRLFGVAAPTDVPSDQLKDESAFSRLLAQSTEDWMISTGLSAGRAGGLLPAFRIAYRDGTPMVTVGGFLPDMASATAAGAVLGDALWAGRVSGVIATPPLTIKEVLALRALLPLDRPLSRADVLAQGFDIAEEHLRSFEAHYQQYPSFAQVSQ